MYISYAAHKYLMQKVASSESKADLKIEDDFYTNILNKGNLSHIKYYIMKHKTFSIRISRNYLDNSATFLYQECKSVIQQLQAIYNCTNVRLVDLSYMELFFCSQLYKDLTKTNVYRKTLSDLTNYENYYTKALDIEYCLTVQDAHHLYTRIKNTDKPSEAVVYHLISLVKNTNLTSDNVEHVQEIISYINAFNKYGAVINNHQDLVKEYRISCKINIIMQKYKLSKCNLDKLSGSNKECGTHTLQSVYGSMSTIIALFKESMSKHESIETKTEIMKDFSVFLEYQVFLENTSDERLVIYEHVRKLLDDNIVSFDIFSKQKSVIQLKSLVSYAENMLFVFFKPEKSLFTQNLESKLQNIRAIIDSVGSRFDLRMRKLLECKLLISRDSKILVNDDKDFIELVSGKESSTLYTKHIDVICVLKVYVKWFTIFFDIIQHINSFEYAQYNQDIDDVFVIVKILFNLKIKYIMRHSYANTLKQKVSRVQFLFVNYKNLKTRVACRKIHMDREEISKYFEDKTMAELYMKHAAVYISNKIVISDLEKLYTFNDVFKDIFFDKRLFISKFHTVVDDIVQFYRILETCIHAVSSEPNLCSEHSLQTKSREMATKNDQSAGKNLISNNVNCDQSCRGAYDDKNSTSCTCTDSGKCGCVLYTTAQAKLDINLMDMQICEKIINCRKCIKSIFKMVKTYKKSKAMIQRKNGLMKYLELNITYLDISAYKNILTSFYSANRDVGLQKPLKHYKKVILLHKLSVWYNRSFSVDLNAMRIDEEELHKRLLNDYVKYKEQFEMRSNKFLPFEYNIFYKKFRINIQRLQRIYVLQKIVDGVQNDVATERLKHLYITSHYIHLHLLPINKLRTQDIDCLEIADILRNKYLKEVVDVNMTILEMYAQNTAHDIVNKLQMYEKANTRKYEVCQFLNDFCYVQKCQASHIHNTQIQGAQDIALDCCYNCHIKSKILPNIDGYNINPKTHNSLCEVIVSALNNSIIALMNYLADTDSIKIYCDVHKERASILTLICNTKNLLDIHKNMIKYNNIDLYKKFVHTIVERNVSSENILHMQIADKEFALQITKKVNDMKNRIPQLYFISDEDLVGVLNSSMDFQNIIKRIYNLDELIIENNTCRGFISKKEKVFFNTNIVLDNADEDQIAMLERCITEFGSALIAAMSDYIKHSVINSKTSDKCLSSVEYQNTIYNSCISICDELINEYRYFSNQIYVSTYKTKFFDLYDMKNKSDCNTLYPKPRIDCANKKVDIYIDSVSTRKHSLAYYPKSDMLYTKLTNTIFNKIALSLPISHGVILYGESSTGKTETVKYYCRTIGVPLYVLCCNERTDVCALQNVVTGCKLNGWYLCLDEFNRLSRAAMSEFSDILHGQDLELNHCSRPGLSNSLKVFITINVGYLGRNPIPSTFKSLFSEVRVDKPNVDDILDVHFDSKSKNVFYMLMNNNSNLAHYNFSLRAVSTIIENTDDLPNDKVLSKQKLETYHVNMQDRKFNNLVMYYYSIFSSKDKLLLNDYINNVGLEDIFTYGIDRCTGMLLYGQSMVGKSTFLRLMIQRYKVRYHVFTKYNEDDLYNILKTCGEQNTWIVFDAILKSKWIENLNSVLDDTKVFCHFGESVKISKNTKFIFETNDISQITPATITRLFTIYFDYINVQYSKPEFSTVSHDAKNSEKCYDEHSVLDIDGQCELHDLHHVHEEEINIANKIGNLNLYEKESEKHVPNRIEQNLCHKKSRSTDTSVSLTTDNNVAITNDFMSHITDSNVIFLSGELGTGKRHFITQLMQGRLNDLHFRYEKIGSNIIYVYEYEYLHKKCTDCDVVTPQNVRMQFIYTSAKNIKSLNDVLDSIRTTQTHGIILDDYGMCAESLYEELREFHEYNTINRKTYNNLKIFVFNHKALDIEKINKKRRIKAKILSFSKRIFTLNSEINDMYSKGLIRYDECYKYMMLLEHESMEFVTSLLQQTNNVCIRSKVKFCLDHRLNFILYGKKLSGKNFLINQFYTHMREDYEIISTIQESGCKQLLLRSTKTEGDVRASCKLDTCSCDNLFDDYKRSDDDKRSNNYISCTLVDNLQNVTSKLLKESILIDINHSHEFCFDFNDLISHLASDKPDLCMLLQKDNILPALQHINCNIVINTCNCCIRTNTGISDIVIQPLQECEFRNENTLDKQTESESKCTTTKIVAFENIWKIKDFLHSVNRMYGQFSTNNTYIRESHGKINKFKEYAKSKSFDILANKKKLNQLETTVCTKLEVIKKLEAALSAEKENINVKKQELNEYILLAKSNRNRINDMVESITVRLKESIEKIKNINKSNLAELKCMHKPPKIVHTVVNVIYNIVYDIKAMKQWNELLAFLRSNDLLKFIQSTNAMSTEEYDDSGCEGNDHSAELQSNIYGVNESINCDTQNDDQHTTKKAFRDKQVESHSKGKYPSSFVKSAKPIAIDEKTLQALKEKESEIYKSSKVCFIFYEWIINTQEFLAGKMSIKPLENEIRNLDKKISEINSQIIIEENKHKKLQEDLSHSQADYKRFENELDSIKTEIKIKDDIYDKIMKLITEMEEEATNWNEGAFTYDYVIQKWFEYKRIRIVTPNTCKNIKNIVKTSTKDSNFAKVLENVYNYHIDILIEDIYECNEDIYKLCKYQIAHQDFDLYLADTKNIYKHIGYSYKPETGYVFMDDIGVKELENELLRAINDCDFSLDQPSELDTYSTACDALQHTNDCSVKEHNIQKEEISLQLDNHHLQTSDHVLQLNEHENSSTRYNIPMHINVEEHRDTQSMTCNVHMSKDDLVIKHIENISNIKNKLDKKRTEQNRQRLQKQYTQQLNKIYDNINDKYNKHYGFNLPFDIFDEYIRVNNLLWNENVKDSNVCHKQLEKSNAMYNNIAKDENTSDTNIISVSCNPSHIHGDKAPNNLTAYDEYKRKCEVLTPHVDDIAMYCFGDDLCIEEILKYNTNVLIVTSSDEALYLLERSIKFSKVISIGKYNNEILADYKGICLVKNIELYDGEINVKNKYVFVSEYKISSKIARSCRIINMRYKFNYDKSVEVYKYIYNDQCIEHMSKRYDDAKDCSQSSEHMDMVHNLIMLHCNVLSNVHTHDLQHKYNFTKKDLDLMIQNYKYCSLEYLKKLVYENKLDAEDVNKIMNISK